MYIEGNIIYFDPFYFKDGDNSKPKYFLVLKRIADTTVLVTLPSSKKHLPNFVTIKHGCLNIPESGISCYIFKSNRIITKCGWSFNLDTFLYGNWIDDYAVSILEERYQLKDIEYKIIGQLTDEEMKLVIDCFVNSKVVKQKYRRLLSQL